MHIHILGIAGTFMAGVATLAKSLGFTVTGSDTHVYPPMSTLLNDLGIEILQDDAVSLLTKTVDQVIVGNVIKRGNPALEHVLNEGIPYCSGPEWLHQHVLQGRHVLAVSGTHGKTTTASLLSFILDAMGVSPGFLIGGVPENFSISARLGNKPFFVIEADEYDSAFCDKRSKFIHYHPRTLIINNLEYDHADIFPNLDAIKQQFHYLIRTLPSTGLIIKNQKEKSIDDVLKMGCWTPVASFGDDHATWHANLIQRDGSSFEVLHENKKVGEVTWSLLGRHNVDNALAALAAAHHVGISPKDAIPCLSQFKNVKRRLEVKGCVRGVTLYDDFAHHPTAIATTLSGLREKVKNARIFVVLEMGSYSMRSGCHKETISRALENADAVYCQKPATDWGIKEAFALFTKPFYLFDGLNDLILHLVKAVNSGDYIVVMSNAGFGGIQQKILSALG